MICSFSGLISLTFNLHQRRAKSRTSFTYFHLPKNVLVLVSMAPQTDDALLPPVLPGSEDDETFPNSSAVSRVCNGVSSWLDVPRKHHRRGDDLNLVITDVRALLL